MSEVTFEEEFHGYKFQVFNSKPDFETLEVKQVHGAVVLKDKTEDVEEHEADGLYSTQLKTPISIKTADCLPIAVIGKGGVALLHAGWRGVHQKIVQSSTLNEIQPYFFYIGPHIQAEHFEVQKDFKDNFPGSHHFKESDGKLTFNLAAEVSDQIHETYPTAEILVSGISTYDNPQFHSFRLDKTAERNWNVLSKLG